MEDRESGNAEDPYAVAVTRRNTINCRENYRRLARYSKIHYTVSGAIYQQTCLKEGWKYLVHMLSLLKNTCTTVDTAWTRLTSVTSTLAGNKFGGAVADRQTAKFAKFPAIRYTELSRAWEALCSASSGLTQHCQCSEQFSLSPRVPFCTKESAG